jgi:tau tubulin kinase
VFFITEKLMNGKTTYPVSSNPGPEEHSIYYDATENRIPVKNISNKITPVTSAIVSNTVILRETQENKNKEISNRPPSVHSKIPIPVRSPRCSLSESTPETNTPNTRTGTCSEQEKTQSINVLYKDKETSSK